MPSPSPIISLHPAGPPDEGLLFRVYAASRATELARSGWNAEQREAFLRAQYQARRAHYALAHPQAATSVIAVGPREAGALIVDRTPAEIRLVDIGLLPEHQGRGVGTALLLALVDEARAAGLPLRLSVREDNTRAARLYRRLGFQRLHANNGYLALEWTRGPKIA